MDIFVALASEWRGLYRSPGSLVALGRWQSAEAALTPFADLGAVVAGVTWEGYRASPAALPVLRALLHLADDTLAARTLLQALLARARAERVATGRFGHGLDEHRQDPADTQADLVAECFAAIKRHAGEDHPDVARLVVQEATRKLRTARQAQRRYNDRHGALGPGEAACGSSGMLDARTCAEWLATAVCTAVSDGRLSPDQARLVYATRVKGLPASETGRAVGLAPKKIYYALSRAERAFVAGAA